MQCREERVKEYLSKKKYTGSEKGNHILAVGLAHASSLTNSAAETLLPCVIASFFANVGISVPINDIANMCPNCETI